MHLGGLSLIGKDDRFPRGVEHVGTRHFNPEGGLQGCRCGADMLYILDTLVFYPID